MIFIYFLLGFFSIFTKAAEWSYNDTDEYGPSNWYKIAPECGKSSQTPINIVTSTTKPRKALLNMNYYQNKVKSVKLSNNGHSLVFEFEFERSSMFQKLLHWTENGQTYIFDSAHIHWGPECGGGSEHFVNGHHYSAELHLVHYNARYSSLSEAAPKADGLAVVGIFFELAEQNFYNESENKFAKFLDRVTHQGETYNITNKDELFNVQDLIKDYVMEYYSYRGSLTTPPCYQSVRWFVSKQPISIYPSELQALQKLRSHKFGPISENFRPLQPLNERYVFDYMNAFKDNRFNKFDEYWQEFEN